MGNCIDHQKAATWVDDDDDDDDWESAEGAMHYSRKEKAREVVVDKEKGLLEGKGGVASTEVKVKISKKQLEELLQRVEGKGLPIQQVLTDLLSLGEVALQERTQHWRPALQSIPESPEQKWMV
ncbi:uncharacterized protein LOC103719103 [Phoenix dactylifera]|uniref:Uncharacterized protein LOC103719103 n=1 Tax=Phoenix dactylifera TaxID=42345 RepID=A0A8B7CU25_PHODC|nr:uncharacterized protein LOC103719103 [Phoenix dactylifera]